MGFGCWIVLLWFGSVGTVIAAEFTAREDVARFVDRLVTQDGFDRAQVQTLLAGIKRQDRVIELMDKPAEAKPWHTYREIFLTEARIQAGVTFWNTNADLLARVAKEQGVPAEIIVAIAGVETFYGRITGGFPVLDTLATLGFDYPKRGRFFRNELREFLLLVKEEHLDPTKLTGSYAGAMGIGQFIPSSYRHYAVDFDQDGKRDLWNSPADACASIAAYLAAHGWQRNHGIATQVTIGQHDPQPLLSKGLEPSLDTADLARYSLDAFVSAAATDRFALLQLQGSDGPEYWLTTANFYAITRYNHSPRYAMAVHQLAQAIATQRRGLANDKAGLLLWFPRNHAEAAARSSRTDNTAPVAIAAALAP